MSEETTEIRGGVIIQGSLFWENEHNCLPNDKKGIKRREWREENLQIDSSFSIPFPIRYGRSSSSRLCTYTMVASREYYEQNKNGQAKVVQYASAFNENSWQNDIRDQIKNLAEVEGIWRQSNQIFANDWGAITIWINPNSTGVKPQLDSFWATIISDYGYGSDAYNWNSRSLITQDFKLDINLDTGANEIDFLLMTYIKPKHKNLSLNSQEKYPTPEQIAQEIKTSGYSTYFCQNRFSGIITSDDEQIIKYMTQ